MGRGGDYDFEYNEGQTYEKWAFTFQGSQIIYAWAMDAKSLELPEGVSLVGLAYATT